MSHRFYDAIRFLGDTSKFHVVEYYFRSQYGPPFFAFGLDHPDVPDGVSFSLTYNYSRRTWALSREATAGGHGGSVVERDPACFDLLTPIQVSLVRAVPIRFLDPPLGSGLEIRELRAWACAEPFRFEISFALDSELELVLSEDSWHLRSKLGQTISKSPQFETDLAVYHN
jgi:hypothetical protein